MQALQSINKTANCKKLQGFFCLFVFFLHSVGEVRKAAREIKHRNQMEWQLYKLREQTSKQEKDAEVLSVTSEAELNIFETEK